MIFIGGYHYDIITKVDVDWLHDWWWCLTGGEKPKLR